MIVICPFSLVAEETTPAMMQSSGGVMVNGNLAPSSTAVFPKDLIETQKNIVARIQTTGSTADMRPETVVQYEGDELVLEHGSVSLDTFRALRVRIGCVTVSPLSTDQTRYEVADIDGKVTVSALKNDIYLTSRSDNTQLAKASARSDRVIVKEGNQKSRDEECGTSPLKEPDHYAGTGAILNSPWAVGVGLAAVGVVTCYALCHDDDPVSPDKPSRP